MTKEMQYSRSQQLLNSANRFLILMWGFLGLWIIAHIEIFGINYVGFVIICLATWSLSFDSKFSADESLAFQSFMNKTARGGRYLLIAFCFVTMLAGESMVLYWIFTDDIETIRLYLGYLEWSGLPDFSTNSRLVLPADLK